jgi:hypothetical protein
MRNCAAQIDPDTLRTKPIRRCRCKPQDATNAVSSNLELAAKSRHAGRRFRCRFWEETSSPATAPLTSPQCCDAM